MSMKNFINNILCKIGIHYDVHENAYYMGEGWYPIEVAGEVKLCLWCGRIRKRGHANIPSHYVKWKKEIRKGIHQFGRF